MRNDQGGIGIDDGHYAESCDGGRVSSSDWFEKQVAGQSFKPTLSCATALR